MGEYKLVQDIETDGYADQAYPDTPIHPVRIPMSLEHNPSLYFYIPPYPLRLIPLSLSPKASINVPEGWLPLQRGARSLRAQ
jgi:hypothetical protein